MQQKRYDEAMDAVLQRRDRTRSKSQLRALKAAQFAMAFSDDDDDESSKQDSPKGHITIEGIERIVSSILRVTGFI